MENKLNSPLKEERIAEIKRLKKAETEVPERQMDVNNHIHTTYSFSPYSPTAAVWYGYRAGLNTVGIMDHDSVSGCYEFLEAANIVGIAATCGVECRVSVIGTPLEGRKINNPDQKSVMYCSLHGIPNQNIGIVNDFFVPYREKRILRDRKMTDMLNTIGFSLDFDRDILPLSMAHEGGSVTERHILFAAAKQITERFGRGKKVIDFCKNELGLNVSAKNEGYLLDTENPFYEYDLLGVLKSDTSKFYIDATDELPTISEISALAERVGAMMTYPYLGDVTNSVTGDKRPQQFEDQYLDELFEILKAYNFKAITYMPSRNTMEQLTRVMNLCSKYGMFQVSGEDINTPRQNFICFAQRSPEFAHLYDAAWALIGHERAATADINDGFFGANTVRDYPDIDARIKFLAEKGKK